MKFIVSIVEQRAIACLCCRDPIDQAWSCDVGRQQVQLDSLLSRPPTHGSLVAYVPWLVSRCSRIALARDANSCGGRGYMRSLRILLVNVTLAGRYRHRDRVAGPRTRAENDRAQADGVLTGAWRTGRRDSCVGNSRGLAIGGPVRRTRYRSREPPRPDRRSVTEVSECARSVVCHDRRAHMSAPPRLGRILRYVAVDYNCLERLTEAYGIPQHLTRVIYNSVDTSRFLSRPPLPPYPQRALVFSNYAGPGIYLDAVQQACAFLNLPVDVLGSVAENSSSAPELVIGRYDLVFAKARCALEAMAVGAAVVLSDTPGLGPLVTSAEVAELRPWNFGARLLREPLDPAGIVRQVQRYVAADASAVSRYIREHADLSTALRQYVHLYDELMNEPLPPPTTVARELDEYLRHTATRMAQMEIELGQYRQPYRMDPLSEAECAQLRLRIETCPESVVCGRTTAVRVELENGSSWGIGSFPPFPVQLSYRWVTDEGHYVAGPEALRTPLRPTLHPHQKASYAMTIAAPDEPGHYRLRVTLVQELVRWFDGLPSPVSADATLVVVSSVAASSTA